MSAERPHGTGGGVSLPERPLRRVLSGGQSGVDRAALDAALACGVPCGGWCPRGRLAEDGVIPDRYPLRETPGAAPEQRTRWNVRDADATLVVAPGAPTGGTALAAAEAERLGRPLFACAPDDPPEAAAAWIRAQGVGVLNVAGPRESEAPGIHDRALALLRAVLTATWAPRGSSIPGTIR